MASKSESPGSRRLKLLGTSPLSFEVNVGALLTIRKLAPSKRSRPTIGKGFKEAGYAVYHGATKVGRLDPKDIAFLPALPSRCRVIEVDRDKTLLRVEIE